MNEWRHELARTDRAGIAYAQLAAADQATQKAVNRALLDAGFRPMTRQEYDRVAERYQTAKRTIRRPPVPEPASGDSFADWLAECTERNPAASERSIVLYRAWAEWCERYEDMPGSHKAFSADMASRGFAKVRTSVGVMVKGLRLRTSSVEGG